VIVTNTTYKIAPWADVLYGFDVAWWKSHVADVCLNFVGERCSQANLPQRYRVTHLPSQRFKNFGNSGTAAMALAFYRGAREIIMVGYDCKREGGRGHWHADHPKPLGNISDRTLNSWMPSFSKLADFLKGKGVKVVNASRSTALTCFDRLSLENALE